MALFKKMVTKEGIERIFKDGKFVKDIDSLPVLVKNMTPGTTITMSEPEITKEVKPKKVIKNEKISFISGEPATKQRFLNGKLYWLTDEEHKLSLGKLSKLIRETVAKSPSE